MYQHNIYALCVSIWWGRCINIIYALDNTCIYVLTYHHINTVDELIYHYVISVYWFNRYQPQWIDAPMHKYTYVIDISMHQCIRKYTI